MVFKIKLKGARNCNSRTNLKILSTLITTEIDYSEINAVRKVARLIADSYFPIDFVDQFRKIYNQNLESYAFLSAKSKDEGNFEGSSLKIFCTTIS